MSTCTYNTEITSSRPGKRRRTCRKVHLKSSQIQRIKIFTRPIPDYGREKGSEELLIRAKKVVMKEFDRLQSLVEAKEISGFEKAWFEASGRTSLNFNFAGMRSNVINAKFGVRDMDDDDFANNNHLQVYLNKNKAMNQDELQKTLLHESLHHNVTAGKGGLKLNEDIDHLAMALLGDPNEGESHELGWLDCVFPRCRNKRCLKYDWEARAKARREARRQARKEAAYPEACSKENEACDKEKDICRPYGSPSW